jgi:2-amino-4-hydroxy-6-hydroxymethyldihydropteridine diphosphokinase
MRRQHLRQAVSALTAIAGVRDLRLSRVIETAPVGGPQQGDYLNAVVELYCSFSAIELLEHVQRIEQEGSRQRSGKNHPRTIDIDILLFGSEQHALPELTIPHPRMLQRSFVLEPLSEFLPEYSNYAATKI